MLLGLAAVTGLALALRRCSRLPAAVCPALAVALFITLGYAGALVGQLQAVTQVLLAAGLMCFAFDLIIGFAKRSSPLVRPEMAIPLMLCLAMAWRLNDATFIVWDDFSHWALASREMLARHKLPEAGTMLQVPWYPPAINLFHYVMLGAAAPTEGNVITAHCALLIFPLACLFHGLTWRRWPLALALVAGLYFALTVLGLGFQTAMSDHVISVFCATSLICWLILRRYGHNPGWVLPLLVVLALIKESGALFAAVLGLAMAVDFALQRRERRQTTVLPTVLVAIVMLFGPLVATASWRAHLNANGISAPPSKVSLTRLQQEWSPRGSEASKAIRHNFFEALWLRPISQIEPNHILASPALPATVVARPYAACSWAVALAILMAAPLLFGTHLLTRRRVAALGAVGALGLVLYAASLLAMYTLIFDSHEAVALASMERYLNSYFATALLVALFLIRVTRMPRGLPGGAFLVAAVVFLWIFQTPSLANLLEPKVDPYRKELEPLLAHVAAVVPPDRVVATIHQDSPGSEVVRVRYELSPRRPFGYWSVGRPYSSGDIWTVHLTPQAFADALRDADYLFLSRADAQFWITYGELFAAEDRFSDTYLYRIEKRRAGVRLEAMAGAERRKLEDPGFNRVTITNPTRLLDNVEITPLNDEGLHVFPTARVENGGFKVTEPTTAPYYAATKTYQLPKGTLVAADVSVRRGGLTFGLVDRIGRMIRPLAMPSGHFLAVIEVEQGGEYSLAFAPNGSGGEAVDIDVTRVGFLGGVRSRHLDATRRMVGAGANILRQDLVIEPLRKQDWRSILAPTVFNGDRIGLRGAPTAFYAVRSQLYRLRKGALVAAKGVVNDGPLVLGLLNQKDEWVYEAVASIPPGSFFAVIQAPADGDYRVILGHPGTSQPFDADVTEIGFLGGFRPPRIAR